MRAPGILGWDREDEFMDWRDLTNKGQPSSSNTVGTNLNGTQPSSVMKITSRQRRRSREDARPRTRETNRTSSVEHRREEARSIDRLEHQFCRENRAIGEPGYTATVVKSRSASSVDAWKEDLDGELDRGSSRRARSKNSSSPIGGDESRAKVKRCAKVVSPTTMEKWKESSRCEMRSRSIVPEDLRSPLQFEESVLRRDHVADDSKDLEDRLRNAGGPDDVSDEDLPAYISSLLVTVERKIERVSLDDMTFPCPACRNIDTDDPLLGCRCAGDDCGCGAGEDNCDCSSTASLSRKEQSAKSFEVAGIKHIDSDDEEEVRMGFGEYTNLDLNIILHITATIFFSFARAWSKSLFSTNFYKEMQTMLCLFLLTIIRRYFSLIIFGQKIKLFIAPEIAS